MSSIRVSSLNVWALPRVISAHVPQRMAAIVDRIAVRTIDVAAFQEVWTPLARNALIECGQRLGFEPAAVEGGSPGGLLVLSRLPVRRTKFTRFRLAGLPQRLHHADYYGRKGFMEVELDAPGGPAVLIATHLHARYSPPGHHDEYLGIRSAQVAQLAAAMNSVAEPCIAIGDFNFREGEPEYRSFTGLSGFADAAVDLDRRQPTSIPGNPYRGVGHHPEERIDYVFTRGGAQAVGLERDFDEPLLFDGEPAAYSDHAGLVAEIELGWSAAGGGVSADPAAIELVSGLLEQGCAEAARRGTRQRLWGGGLLALSLPARSRAARTLGLVSAVVMVLLSQRIVAAELAGYQDVRAMVDRMR